MRVYKGKNKLMHEALESCASGMLPFQKVDWRTNMYVCVRLCLCVCVCVCESACFCMCVCTQVFASLSKVKLSCRLAFSCMLSVYV